ncbi:hypothetical protein LOTGIDRAFT_233512 [Lottia gigantea]|uniref:Peptidase M14 domain-containing protein n=1 Tax=Lottia gigantea TaxID=225164 RepID=V4A2U5_LOTGI|nr:hypothetical protein LOTGIDRAFT_233512 [Lottia gigantea]ESO91017.1 hypothetical protein LOTGIDRAFT_233512 [Lottia gigantea]
MKMGKEIGCLLVLIVFTLAQNIDKPFLGHKVLRIKPSTPEDVQTLSNLENNLELDFWHMPHSDDGHMDVRVKPEFLQQLLNKVKLLNLEYQEIIQDVQSLVDHEHRSVRSKRAISDLQSYTTTYLSYAQINEFLGRVARESGYSQQVYLGTSYEGRPTYAIKIGYSSNNPNKPAIFIDAGFHAREWIAPATAINFIYQLAINPNEDSQLDELVDKFDFYIVPIVNPDGYEYSRQNGNNRFWRKTRSQTSSKCFGVDINRNFGYQWNPSAGGSRYPCSDLYAGNSSFSEIESQNIRNFMISKRPNLKGYLTLHSYGQFWLYPWGYSASDVPSDNSILEAIARNATSAMQNRYTIGRSAAVLYVAAGGSDDYAKGAAGIPYAYTVELPPTGYTNRGFALPVSSIPGVATDTLKGLKAFSYSVANRIGLSAAPPTTTRAPYVPPNNQLTNNYYQFWWNHYFGK